LRCVAHLSEHRVDRIEALARAALPAVAIERNSEREHLTGRREPARRRDPLRRDVVQRADLVVRSPLAPVPDRKRDLPQCLFAHRYSPAAGTGAAPTMIGRGTRPGRNETKIAVSADIPAKRSST